MENKKVQAIRQSIYRLNPQFQNQDTNSRKRED